MPPIWTMVFWSLVIIGAVIYSIVGSVQSMKRTRPASPVPQKKPNRSRGRDLLGSKGNWAWMQTAGAFGLKFVRPEESGNACPAISGTVNDIRVMIQGLPRNDLTGGSRSTVFQFFFPHSAGIKLNLMLIRDSEQLRRQTAGRQSLSLDSTVKAGLLSGYFFQSDAPEIFSKCCPPDCLSHLIRLSQTYPAVMLTDNALLVHLAGFPDEPQRFRLRLGTLLDIAMNFSVFTELAAEMRKKVRNESAQKPATRKTEPKPEPAAANPVVPEPPKTIPETARADADAVEPPPFPEPADQSAFVRALWAQNRNSGQLRELFAPYVETEVEWQGTLKTHFRFSSAPVFDGTAGVKAAFELEEFKPEGGFLSIRIKAVVFFPPETESALARGTGKVFRFRGRFLKIEPIAKEIHLAGMNVTPQEETPS